MKQIYKLLLSAKEGLFALALTVFFGTAYAQTTYTYNYTGSTQTISLPAGNYSVECWGAIGGWHANDPNTLRGKSGYSSGTLSLTTTTTLFISVGGAGGTQINNTVPGGWNGGGPGKYYTYAFNSGGGATHMATATGTLAALASNTAAVLIVAAGGGGGSSGQTPGNGGGSTGGNSTRSGCTGGTQTSPGGSSITGGNATFGQGWDANQSGGSYGAGGGGWYGGGCESGGSSYIGGVNSGTTIMFGQTGFVANPDLNGNGWAIITELCSISLSASGSNSTAPSICSGQSVTLTTNAVSNYAWSTGNTTSSVIVVSPSSTTVYTLAAMSASNCMASRSITVTVSGGLPALTITNTPNSMCLGKTATLTAGGALSYTWTGGSTTVTNGVSFFPTASTVYTVTGQNGCGISTATTAITIAPLVVTASTSSSLVCAGSPATLTAVSSVSGYTWMPNNIASNPLVVAPSVNTIYTVAASDGTCFGTATVAVNTKPTPTLSIAASSSVVCEGALVTMTASGALTYSWTSPSSSNASISDYPAGPTLYNVSGTNSLNCTSQASQIVLTETVPIVVVVANKTIVCSGGQVTLTASGANAYNWVNGPSTAINLVSPLVATVYTVTGIASNSCTSDQTISINVLSANVSVSAATTSICNGGTTTLTASGANTYIWAGVFSFNGIAPVSPSATTVYSVTATTTVPGLSCPSSSNITITVFNNPTVNIVASKTVVCKSDPAVTLTGTGAVTYAWSTNTTSAAISVHPLSTTTYSVIGTDANGCQNTKSVEIKVNSCNSIGELSGSEKGLRVYPNPSNGVFELSSETEMDLSLMNELGQQIRTIKLSSQNNYTVRVDDLANGVYFIVGQNNNKAINEKIIISK